MTLFQKGGEPVHFDAHAQEVYDVTGAGDTVIGCLGVALAAGAAMREAADLANTAAGIVVGQIGTTAIKFAELEQAVRERPIGVSRS
jgi:D-beta-D-heptose 7-phosphate kinase/D-beta-D-heptose 1-phosphate adenosyltransferase